MIPSGMVEGGERKQTVSEVSIRVEGDQAAFGGLQRGCRRNLRRHRRRVAVDEACGEGSCRPARRYALQSSRPWLAPRAPSYGLVEFG